MTHNEFVEGVIARLKCQNGDYDLKDVEDILHQQLQNVKLEAESTELITLDADKRGAQLRRFLACKMTEGCTRRTIEFYQGEVHRLMKYIPKAFEQITEDDIRYYISIRNVQDRVSKVTQNNELRVFKTFFNWCVDEDIVRKSPARAIKKIKTEKLVKKAFSQDEIEQLRFTARSSLRTTAILELLLSSGMRVGELARMKRSDINEDEAVVYGKGQKERTIFLNARAQFALNRYLDSRDDFNDALFVSLEKPHNALKISAFEIVVRELGKEAGVEKVHPHRFRRTAATMALNRGMPIDQVQKMLGHSEISTTQIYAQASMETVKQAHKKYM